MKSNAPCWAAMRNHYFEPTRTTSEISRSKGAGVPIDAVTIRTRSTPIRMGACRLPVGQEYEIEFVKSHLGPLLRKEASERRFGSLTTTTICGPGRRRVERCGVYEFVDGLRGTATAESVGDDART